MYDLHGVTLTSVTENCSVNLQEHLTVNLFYHIMEEGQGLRPFDSTLRGRGSRELWSWGAVKNLRLVDKSP